MAQQTINNGTFDNDPGAESIRSAFDKTNANFTEVYGLAAGAGLPVFNVKSYGAVGDDTADDTAAIQAANDAASAAGGTVYFPGAPFGGANRYKITSTIARGQGVHWLGHMHEDVSRLRWHGAADGTMVSVIGTGQNIPWFRTECINFDGRSVAGKLIRFAPESTTTARPDYVFFEKCIFRGATGNGVSVESKGITNMFLSGCHFDEIDGYGFYSLMAEVFSDAHVRFTDCQWVRPGSETVFANGFAYFNAETGGQGARTYLHIDNLKCEINGPLNNTYPTGIQEADKRGLIRLGVNPSHADRMQHIITAHHIKLMTGTLADSYCLFQLTGGTEAENVQFGKFDLANIHGTGFWGSAPTKWNKIIGNVPARHAWPFEGTSATVNRQLTAAMWQPPGAGSGAAGATLLHGKVRASQMEIAPEAGTLAPQILAGTSTPEGAVTAPMGSLFLRTDGAASTSLYVKTSGTGNTGWTAK